MKVRTTRFGEVEIDPTRLLVFPHGLLGFARFRTFALLQPDDRGVFYWLQSIEDPELAFVDRSDRVGHWLHRADPRR